jgi:transcriptional regulator with XRE-family HTH domain
MNKETNKEKEDRRKRLKLVRLALGKNVTDFADMLEIKQGSLSDIEGLKKKVGVSKAIRAKLFEKLNVNKQWFETGKGDMFCATIQDQLLKGVIDKYHPRSQDNTKTDPDNLLEVEELKRKLELVSEENSILKDQLIEALRKLGGF